MKTALEKRPFLLQMTDASHCKVTFGLCSQGVSNSLAVNALWHVLCPHWRVKCHLRRTSCFQEICINRGKIASVRGGERTAEAAECGCFSVPALSLVWSGLQNVSLQRP